jgi:thiamine biosynthesis lipoprotein
MKHIALLLIAALTLASCHHDPLVTLQGETQGSYYTIRYYDQQQRNLTPQIDSILTLVDNTLSLWNENSLIRRINNGTDSLISPLFHDILTKANTMRLYTNGALDCRIGTLVNLYGFGFEKRTEVTQQQIDTILSQLSRQTYLIADSNLTLPTPTYTLRRLEPFEFDFNAIAQGYTSDLIGHLFDSLGINNYIINIGGEVLAKGTK